MAVWVQVSPLLPGSGESSKLAEYLRGLADEDCVERSGGQTFVRCLGLRKWPDELNN